MSSFAVVRHRRKNGVRLRHAILVSLRNHGRGMIPAGCEQCFLKSEHSYRNQLVGKNTTQFIYGSYQECRTLPGKHRSSSSILNQNLQLDRTMHEGLKRTFLKLTDYKNVKSNKCLRIYSKAVG